MTLPMRSRNRTGGRASKLLSKRKGKKANTISRLTIRSSEKYYVPVFNMKQKERMANPNTDLEILYSLDNSPPLIARILHRSRLSMDSSHFSVSKNAVLQICWLTRDPGISMALLLAKIAAWNYKTQGSVFGKAEILHLMVDRDLFVMLTTDATMCAATSFGFFLQKAVAKNYLTWNGAGWKIQSAWQIFYTVTVIWVSFWRDWPWTHTVFIVLHVFVLLMKQHAYAFYNGYCKFQGEFG